MSPGKKEAEELRVGLAQRKRLGLEWAVVRGWGGEDSRAMQRLKTWIWAFVGESQYEWKKLADCMFLGDYCDQKGAKDSYLS